MIRQLFEQVKENAEVRQALIQMKAAVKEKGDRNLLQQCYEEEPEILLGCLQSEDAKVRKNAALILGCLTGSEIAEQLWQSYQTEGQLFVKSDYLKALQAFDCAPYLEQLNQRSKELEDQLSVQKGEDTKHLRQELTELRKLLYQQKEDSGHRFTGYETPVDILFLTNKGFERCLEEQLQKAVPAGQETVFRPVKGGVMAEKAKLKDLLGIRTWRELLFSLKGSRKMEKEQAAELLWKTNLMELLESLHEGQAPYYFRIDCKSRMDQQQKSEFCKRVAARLEELSGGKLQNAPSAYEIEVRFVENKEGTFYPLLKLHTWKDKRFSYRKYTVAASIAPVQAAICMELASEYLKEDAQVLDPFCGVGTMLLERNYRLHANTLYGIDLYAPAVEGARANTEIAGVPAHFINKDSTAFTHKYLFDEIVTNFPVQGKSLNAHDLDCLYRKFLERAEVLLKPDGMILLYTHDRGYAKKHLRISDAWKLEKEWCISEKEGAYLLYIIRR